MTQTLQGVLERHPFLEGIRPDLLALMTGCAKNRRFDTGEYVTRESEEADHFFLIRTGKVAAQIRGSTGEPVTIHTLGRGDVVGWSWLVAPHRYRYDTVATETTTAFELDGRCLREKCEANSELGYELLKRVSANLARRIEDLQLQLVDVYRSSGG
jgi:CRP-like cAMP-binding protein